MTGKQLTLLGGSFGPPPAYQIQRSLRFNSADSAYLNRTLGSGDRKTWTWSGWVKRAALSNDYGGTLISCATGTSDGNSGYFWFYADAIRFQSYNTQFITTTAVYRDVSAWYHIVLAVDTTQATSSNRIKLYVNGTQVTAFAATNYPAQNTDLSINSANSHTIGLGDGVYSNFYLADVNFIDGQALTPSSFGETDADTGIWKPKAFSGTYGTNGFYLDFSDNSGTTSTTLGKDYSGNSNNFTPNNFSVTAGVGNDSLVDTPTPYGTDTGAGGEVRGNYNTLNPLTTTAGTYTQGNLRYEGASGWRRSSGTIPVTTGKWYWEVTLGNSPFTPRASTTAYNAMGFCLASTFNSTTSFSTQTDALLLGDNGYYKNFTNSPVDAGAFSSGDVLAVAVDLDANTFTFYKNNSSVGTGTIGGTAGRELTPCVLSYDGVYGVMDCNFGQRPFAYTAPSGFKALVTQNLPTPTVIQGDDYFDTVIWSANGSGAVDRTITSSFQPDMIWSKTRSAAYHNNIFDAVRGFGSNNSLVTDQSWSEGTASGGRIKSVASNSFTWEAGGSAAEWYNQSSNTYVSWYWKANGAGSSNTAGTITSTASVSTLSGFSIVTYTGTGANATVGHGLGVAPSMIIVKGRNVATSWRVYHTSIGNTGAMYFNLTNATDTNSVFWNNTSPTSSVFTVGTDPGVNGSSNTFVAYCFAPVAGYSAFGKYVGNGSADGPFVYLGFRPKWILIKPSDSADSWQLEDAVRSPFNTVNDQLFPNSAQAEQVDSATRNTDFLSNGFKLRGTNSGVNGNAVNYIYAAFAENPFKYSLAR